MVSITHRTKKVRFLVATGSQLISEGFLGTTLGRRDMEVTVVQDAIDVLTYCANVGKPDVLVIDPFLAELIRPHAQMFGCNSRVVLLWARPHSGEAELPRQQWVCGLLRICASANELVQLIDAVMDCGISQAGEDKACSTCMVKRTTHLPALPLSRREFDVFKRLGRGVGVKRIAADLALSVKTVESHRESIKRKLDLDDAAALFEAAILWRRGEYVGPYGQAVRRVDAAPAALPTGGCFHDGEPI